MNQTNSQIFSNNEIDPEIQKAFDQGKIFVLDNGIKSKIEKLQKNAKNQWRIKKEKINASPIGKYKQQEVENP